jgi:hypothetical protein
MIASLGRAISASAHSPMQLREPGARDSLTPERPRPARPPPAIGADRLSLREGSRVTAPSNIEIEIHTPESCILTLHGEHDSASREGLTLALTLARN